MDVGARTAPELVLLGPGPRAGERLGLRGRTTTVGRDAGCDLRLDDPAVSARHAQLLRDAAGVRVVDLGSTNGTWVGDEPVHGERRLRPGEVVTFAGVSVRLEGPAGADAPDAGAGATGTRRWSAPAPPEG